MLNRRDLMLGLAATVAAPAVIHAAPAEELFEELICLYPTPPTGRYIVYFADRLMWREVADETFYYTTPQHRECWDGVK